MTFLAVHFQLGWDHFNILRDLFVCFSFSDHFEGVELDALHSSIEALRARLRRLTQPPEGSPGNQQRQTLGKNYVQDAQISQLRSLMEKLSLLNSENLKKVKVVESALKKQESSRY